MRFAAVFKTALAWTLLALVPAAFWADTALALAEDWRPGSALERTIISTAAILSAALAGSLVFKRFRAWLQNRCWDIVFVVLSQALLFVGVENAVQAMAVASAPPYHHYAPNIREVRPTADGDVHFFTNSLGIRGPELPADSAVLKVLCVGSSTTRMPLDDQSVTWYQSAMEQLNRAAGRERYWFGAVGINGFATANHRRYAEESPLFDDIDVALYLAGINDSALPLTIGKRPLWVKSNFMSRLTDARLSIRTQLFRTDKLTQALSDARKQRETAPRMEDLPPAQRLATRYQSSVGRLIDATRARGVTPVFLTHPALWSDQPNDPYEARYWAGFTRSGRYLTASQLRERLDAINGALRRACEEKGAICIDLSFMDGNPAYFYDDCHFTPEGAAVVARVLADWFQANGERLHARRASGTAPR